MNRDPLTGDETTSLPACRPSAPRTTAGLDEFYGRALPGPVPEADFDLLVDVNLKATFFMCAAAIPALAGICEAAPLASFRVKGLKISREPPRYSGRTAMRANQSVHEPRQPQDGDTALSFSMEGYGGIGSQDRPAELTPYAWSPGWNSPSAVAGSPSSRSDWRKTPPSPLNLPTTIASTVTVWPSSGLRGPLPWIRAIGVRPSLDGAGVPDGGTGRSGHHGSEAPNVRPTTAYGLAL